MTSPTPTRPDPTAVPDIPLQGLAALLELHQRTIRELPWTRVMAAEDLRAQQDHAVKALVVQTALLQRIPKTRWMLITRGLLAGADAQRLADAAGYADVEELRVDLAAALEVLVRDGHTMPAERDAVLALLDDGPR